MLPDRLKRLFLRLSPVRVHHIHVVGHVIVSAAHRGDGAGDVQLVDGDVVAICVVDERLLQERVERVPAVPAIADQDADDLPPALMVRLPEDLIKTASISS